MKRSLLTAVGIMMLTLAVPSAALAHHGHGPHHHKARAKAHHAKFRIMHIGAAAVGTTTAPIGTTPPATPLAPENAGMVASYTNGILTLTLSGGSTVSGKVTNDTRIGCVKANPTTLPAGTETQPLDQSPGDDNGQGDNQSSDDTSQQSDHESGEWQPGDKENGGDGSDETAGDTEPPCDSSTLVTGAVLRAAELRIGPGGTEFESVWLVR